MVAIRGSSSSTVSLGDPALKPRGMGSFKALLLRASKLPIPLGNKVVKSTVPKAEPKLDFFQGRAQIGDQIIRVLDAD
jgi:hypothetical protein